MTVLLEHIVLPPGAEAPSMQPLVDVLAGDSHAALLGPDGARIELPSAVFEVLQDVVQAMSQGKAITIAPQDTVLTTQQAADMVGVSRPTLVRLLESGAIPYSQPGRHRRVGLSDLIAYQARTRRSRSAILADMAYESAHNGLDERVTDLISTR